MQCPGQVSLLPKFKDCIGRKVVNWEERASSVGRAGHPPSSQRSWVLDKDSKPHKVPGSLFRRPYPGHV